MIRDRIPTFQNVGKKCETHCGELGEGGKCPTFFCGIQGSCCKTIRDGDCPQVYDANGFNDPADYGLNTLRTISPGGSAVCIEPLHQNIGISCGAGTGGRNIAGLNGFCGRQGRCCHWEDLASGPEECREVSPLGGEPVG